jgi:serine/threonine-protein kinase
MDDETTNEEKDKDLEATVRGGSSTSSMRPPPIGPSATMSALVVGPVIAEGGMGLVRTAVQRSLGRSVVIKTALASASPRDAGRMLLEAWVTGYLEHPGIVPIYDIVRGDDEAPVVVMRRVRGKTWYSYIRDAAWAESQGARDLLEQNLRVFIRVCEILEFAHAQHVVHRDLKPGNVMVGTFGEVYLLDWGLAVATGGEPAHHLPLASLTHEVCGTMSYAAPEMVGLLDVAPSPRTDVYLLGSVLFEIATGKPPHRKEDDIRTLDSIASTPPPIPATVAPRLGAICTRALQKHPNDRYADVADLRRDILAFLRQRDSEHVVHEAEAVLARLLAACDEDAPRQRIYDLHGECRFAFNEALRTWPDNEIATRGLTTASRRLVEHELARDPRSAAVLLANAPVAMPDLAERVNAAVLAEEQAREALSKVARDHDASIGRRGRRYFLGFMALLWIAGQVFGDRIAAPTYRRFIVGSLLQLPIVLLAWALTPELRVTLFNRRMVGTILVFIGAQLSLFAAGAQLGVELQITRVAQIGLWALILTMVSVVFDKRFWPATLGVGLCALAVVFAPAQRTLLATLSIAAITLNVLLIRSTAS